MASASERLLSVIKEPAAAAAAGSSPRPRRIFSDIGRLSFGHYSINSQGYRKLSDVFPLGAKTSLLLPHLKANERKFFELVGSGDVDAAKSFLGANPGFNVNCMNFQGVTALHIAVQNRYESMVECLLDQDGIVIGDNVLHAIRNNDAKIMTLLLNRSNRISPGLEFTGCTHSSEFPDHMTPLILACQCGHYEIVELLIERGHRIAKPHPPDCVCPECTAHFREDDLLHAETLRLNLYRAICNPAYISHTTIDPILEAFNLSIELRRCSRLSPEFRVAYEELATEISRFAVDLIACCRNAEEMHMVLRQKDGVAVAGAFTYPRLVLALDYKQKEFVAHPNTQKIVETAWVGGWREWRLKSGAIKLLHVIARLLLLPLMCVMCVTMPGHRLVRHWSVPLNKMISHGASYFVFLALVFVESNQDKAAQPRRPPDTGLEPFIVVYVVGFIWGSLRLCAIQGPARFFRSLWNCFDVIMYVLYLFTFFFWLASHLDALENDQVDLERKYWHPLDPLLIAEGCFAVAVIMSYFRLLYLCRLSYYLGPLQISLGKMSADIARYITIFAIIILAFTAGMCRFYHYYDGMVQVDDASGMKTAQVASFVDFTSTLKTFFWALFCMAPLETGDVIIENLPGESAATTIINKHKFTESIGYIAFALFEFITVIIILNMLIATMSSTFQRVTDNVDVEWTFGKTLFYVDYMIQTTLPAPFNLIPTGAGVLGALEWFTTFNKSAEGKTAHWSPLYCCYIDTEMEETMRNNLPMVMAQLVQRYFREKDASADTTETDIDQIKQELNDLKRIIKEE